MTAFALVGLLVALLLAYGAMLALIIDCNEDSGSTCSRGGFAQLGLALVGVVLSLVAFIAGITGRSRPGVWLAASAATFAVWIVLIFAIGEID
jgi:hypothetical protein